MPKNANWMQTPCHRQGCPGDPVGRIPCPRIVMAGTKPGHDVTWNKSELSRSHRPDFDNVRNEVLQQVLNAMLQRRGR
jgi:hypothetical protein